MRTVLSLVGGVPLAVALALLAVACGDESGGTGAGGDTEGRPTVVVTTSVWGDVVDQVVGDLADVEVLMPRGADPHEFAPSARQADQMERADVVVANGLGLEQGLTAVLDGVEAAGTPILLIGEMVAPYVGDSGPGTDEAVQEADRPAGQLPADVDPHVWMDPVAVAEALPELGAQLAATTGLDPDRVDAGARAYAARLRELDAEVRRVLAAVPAGRRLLVTNHDSFGAFAARYGFEVLGTVIPANTTSAEASAADLDELATLIREHDVPAIFVETTESDRLAGVVADEVGGVEVVELYTGSLGEPGTDADTFVGLHRTNARRIADALD
jgi:zinc/manganese transport system substrate-binding protein